MKIMIRFHEKTKSMLQRSKSNFLYENLKIQHDRAQGTKLIQSYSVTTTIKGYISYYSVIVFFIFEKTVTACVKIRVCLSNDNLKKKFSNKIFLNEIIWLEHWCQQILQSLQIKKWWQPAI